MSKHDMLIHRTPGQAPIYYSHPRQLANRVPPIPPPDLSEVAGACPGIAEDWQSACAAVAHERDVIAGFDLLVRHHVRVWLADVPEEHRALFKRVLRTSDRSKYAKHLAGAEWVSR